MFSLIIVLVSVALVTLLAIATIYYGGSAALNWGAGAKASTVTNQATQLYGAAVLFKEENGCWPANPAQLTGNDPSIVSCTGEPNTKQYLNNVPVPPLTADAKFEIISSAYAANPAEWEFLKNSAGSVDYIVLKKSLGATVCTAVQRAAKRDSSVWSIFGINKNDIPTALDPNLGYQCVNDFPAPPTGEHRFSYFWRLPGAKACDALAQYNAQNAAAGTPTTLGCKNPDGSEGSEGGGTTPPPVTPPTTPKYTCINENPYIDVNGYTSDRGWTGVDLIIEGPGAAEEFGNIAVGNSGPNTISAPYPDFSIDYLWGDGRLFTFTAFPTTHAPANNVPYIITGATGATVTCPQTVVPEFSHVDEYLNIEVSPNTGARSGGYSATITAAYGTKFRLGPQGEKPVVYWSSYRMSDAEVTYVNDTTLTVPVPSIQKAGGDEAYQVGQVMVQNYGNPYSGFAWFDYAPPQSATMTPTEGRKGTVVTITGEFPANPSVRLGKGSYESANDLIPEMISHTASTIVIKVPEDPEQLTYNNYYTVHIRDESSTRYEDGNLTFTYIPVPRLYSIYQVELGTYSTIDWSRVPTTPDRSTCLGICRWWSMVPDLAGWADVSGNQDFLMDNLLDLSVSVLQLQSNSTISVTIDGTSVPVKSIDTYNNKVRIAAPPMSSTGVKYVEMTIDGTKLDPFPLVYSDIRVTGISASQYNVMGYQSAGAPPLVLTGSGFKQGMAVNLYSNSSTPPAYGGAGAFQYCQFGPELVNVSADGTTATIQASAFKSNQPGGSWGYPGYVFGYPPGNPNCDKAPDGAITRAVVFVPYELTYKSGAVALQAHHNVSSPTFILRNPTNKPVYSQVVIRGIKSVNPISGSVVVFSMGMPDDCKAQSSIDAQNTCWANAMAMNLANNSGTYAPTSCTVSKGAASTAGYAEQMYMTCTNPNKVSVDNFPWWTIGLQYSSGSGGYPDVVKTQ